MEFPKGWVKNIIFEKPSKYAGFKGMEKEEMRLNNKRRVHTLRKVYMIFSCMQDLFRKEKEVVEQEIQKNYQGLLPGLKTKFKDNFEIQGAMQELMEKFSIPKPANPNPFDYDSQEEVLKSNSRRHKRNASDGSFSGSDSSFKDVNFSGAGDDLANQPAPRGSQNRRDLKRAWKEVSSKRMNERSIPMSKNDSLEDFDNVSAHNGIF